MRELKSKRTTRVLRPVSTVLHAAGDAIEQGGKLGEGAVAATEHVLRTLRKSHLGKGLTRLGQATKGAGDFVRDVEEGAAAVGERDRIAKVVAHLRVAAAQQPLLDEPWCRALPCCC